jgi:hypothetical protein
VNWGEIWQAIRDFAMSLADWFDQNPIYALVAIAATIGEFIGLVLTIPSLRRSRRRELEEQRLKEEQIRLNEEISDKLSYYEELFNEIDVNRQLKHRIAQRKARITKADNELRRLDLSIEERERLRAEKEKALEQLEEEEKKLLEQKERDITRVEKRLKQVVATAQNEALRETIKKRLEMLERELSEIEDLKQAYNIEDENLDLPSEVKEDLKNSLHELVPERQEFLPRPYVIQIFFLALLVFLLPHPIDNVVLVMFAVPVFAFVVDAAKHLKNDRLNSLISKWADLLAILTLYALWIGILAWLRRLVDPFLDEAYEYISQALASPEPQQVAPLVTGLSEDPITREYPVYLAASKELLRLARFGLNTAHYFIAVALSMMSYLRVKKPLRRKITEAFGSHQQDQKY